MPQPAHHQHNPAHTYRVTRQETSTHIGPDGHPAKVWTVHIEHQDGTKDTVTLPDHQYTAENVHALASAQAADVARVAQLPGSVEHSG